ncbi:hypothetical protein Csa_023769, partial [Cucumis sativus]
ETKNNQAELSSSPPSVSWCSSAGTSDGDKAKNKSNDIINTGTNSSNTGGGGNGGSTSGNIKRDTATTINIATDLKLKNPLTIKPHRRRGMKILYRTQLGFLLVHIGVKAWSFYV